jgi:hypothetical protein
MRYLFSTTPQALWLKAQLSRLVIARGPASGDFKSNCKPGRFVLEPLENRMLLSADLTGVIGSAALIDPAVPTNTASAIVQVRNIGNQQANPSQVAIYSSFDTQLDNSDVLLGTTNVGKLNAGASKDVTVDFTIPNTIDPGPYRLLAKVDNANAITENSETNNVAVGETLSVAWKFGDVLGRTGNTALTLRDTDGTKVTFSIVGAGTGELTRDGANWNVTITGTAANSKVNILTDNAGNGRVTIHDIHVAGPLGSFIASTTDLTGTLAIDGPANIPGPLPSVTIGSVNGGTLAVPAVETLTIVGSVTNARIYIGTSFGQDGKLGGSGANADAYGQGIVRELLTIGGSVTSSVIRVGVDPMDGIFGNGNDTIVGGISSSIAAITIEGSLSADSMIIAGALPPVAHVDGKVIHDLDNDPRFSTDGTRLLLDSDGDGIPDSDETGGSNAGDANHDGVPDSQQANVASARRGEESS